MGIFCSSLTETLNKLISLMPFDFSQESARQAHHERNQRHAVRPELVEGLIQGFHVISLFPCRQ